MEKQDACLGVHSACQEKNEHNKVVFREKCKGVTSLYLVGNLKMPKRLCHYTAQKFLTRWVKGNYYVYRYVVPISYKATAL